MAAIMEAMPAAITAAWNVGEAIKAGIVIGAVIAIVIGAAIIGAIVAAIVIGAAATAVIGVVGRAAAQKGERT
jgi:hypothetical protein